MKKSEIIVDKLVSDLTDRSGFDEAWYSTDDGIKEEIKQEWIRIINQELEQVKPTQAAEGLKLGDMNIEFGKKDEVGGFMINYEIGMDIAEPNSKDYSALSMLCRNCNSVIHNEVFIGEQPLLEKPKKCPKCGIVFKLGIIYK